MIVIAAELTPQSRSLEELSFREENLAVILGNEVEGVLPSTLTAVDHIVQIPMKGIKESLNVGQSAAIFMREWRNN